MSVLVEACNLTRCFGDTVAVSDVSIAVRAGEVVGFLGPNGAGKTTTMRMIAGFLVPSAGSVRVAGHDMAGSPLLAKAAIGYLPEGAPACPGMTPLTFLEFVAGARDIHGSGRQAALKRVIGLTGLGPVLERAIETLSKGYRRRVGIAQSLLHDPPALLLDEPTDGLDPNQKNDMRVLIRELTARKKAIILSTHILEEVEAVCTRALIIAGGKIREEGHPEEGGWRFGQRLAPPGQLDRLFREITLAPGSSGTP